MPYRLMHASPQFTTFGEYSEKFQVVFSSPAVLKVFVLQCDLFSLGRVYVYDENEKLVKNDPALDRFKKPNFFQRRNQFLWDFMFWKMLGNAHLYLSSKLVERDNAPMYWLDPSKIEWPLELDKYKDNLVLSQSTLKEILSLEIIYRYESGETKKIKLSEVVNFADLSNGIGNWFKGHSRLDALYKIVANSEVGLDSKNINVRYTGKFMVAGTQDPKDVTKTPMSETEKTSIEERVNKDDKQVYAMRSLIDIKRFVDDIRVMPLDESFLADYYFIGSMYNIPKDILEAFAKGSTFENQEKSMGRHVSYTLEPAGEQLGDGVGEAWGYADKQICLSWDHLPFNQVFEKDRALVQQTKISTFNSLLKAGVKLEEANAFLDLNFSELTPPEPAQPNGQRK